MKTIIEFLIGFFEDLRNDSPMTQFFALLGPIGLIAGICSWIIHQTNRKVQSSVTRRQELENELATAQKVARDLETALAEATRKGPAAFLEHHAREMRDGNETAAMAAAETFIDDHKEALLCAFRSRMVEAIGQAPEDGAASYDTARLWARAALALRPGDRMLRMLEDDLSNAAAMAGRGISVRLKPDADRAARLARYERLPRDLEPLTAAIVQAREKGQYALMLFLARHALVLTCRAPFGDGTTPNLEARYWHAEATLRCGDTKAALGELETLRPLDERVRGPEHPETLATRYLQAHCLNDAGDPKAALGELETLRPLDERIRGPEHPNTLATRYLQAHCLNAAGDTKAALGELETLRPLYERVRGPEHPDTLATRLLQAECHLACDEAVRAETASAGLRDGFLAAGLPDDHKWIKRLVQLEAALAERRHADPG